MQTAFSDIYNCTACNDALSFPVDEDSEGAHHWPALVCLACSLAYRVDEATGELLPVEDVIGKLRAEVERLTAELNVARRLLPPRYVAANGSIMDPERCTPHAPDCAECGRGRAHDEACLGLAATPAEESVGLRDAIASVTSAVERLTAERAELLAPAGAVDVGAVLARANRLVPAFIDWDNLPSSVWAEVIEQITAAPIMARELIRASMERDAIAQALDDDCAPDIDGDRVKTLADRVNALLGHWQDEIRGALCAVVPDPHRIDGGGCDSGDPLDLTLAEVAQAVNQLTDQADEQIAALTAERDAARRNADRLIKGAIANLRLRPGRARAERWAHVRDLFGVGSTRAQELCAAHGFDPDELI